MKKKTKILITLLISLTLIAAFAISAFASEAAPDASEENAFNELYGFILENADKIFSLLAFLGAIILSFAYKKGLFPFVKKALATLSGAVSSIKEEAEKSSVGTKEFTEEIKTKLALSENILKGFEEKLSGLEEKLTEAALLNDKTEEFRSVMLAEVEMIYNIFVSSSLPQYQKDKVGEAYLKMKKMLDRKEA
ncbi:MAG: hypothetical protein IJW38_04205 [Clostridia bacterium]|nr:hypothetical protein [Clostridia bacterium]